MKTKETLKLEFDNFFKKHPTIKKLPFLLTIIVPKYECQGERIVDNTGILLENYEYVSDFLEAEYIDIKSFWESIMKDIPTISDKDAFYIFDENTMVIVHNTPEEVKFQEIDFSDEIHDMY